MEGLLKQSTAVNITILMIDSIDHVTGKTGLAAGLTIYATKAAGTPAAITPTVTELDTTNVKGVYKLALTAAHTDTLGELQLHITATGADPTDLKWQVTTFDLATALAQTGDAYAIVNNGTYGNSALNTAVAGVQTDTNDLQTQIGTAGAGLTALVDLVWDEVLTGATHNIAASAGRRLRQLASNVLHSGTAQAGGVNTITLDVGASSTDNIYGEALIAIDGGTGVGQAHHILCYIGATKVATIDDDWVIVPDITSTFQIYGSSAMDAVIGCAQGGAANTITLNALASTIDNTYIDGIIYIPSGTGSGQWRRIIDYNGTTKIATVDKNWTTNPANGSGYMIFPEGKVRTFVIDGVII